MFHAWRFVTAIACYGLLLGYTQDVDLCDVFPLDWVRPRYLRIHSGLYKLFQLICGLCYCCSDATTHDGCSDTTTPDDTDCDITLEFRRAIASRRTNPCILIIGHARHGKDTLGDIIGAAYDLKVTSSSKVALNEFVFEALKNKHGYFTPDECFLDRVKHRDEWFRLIEDYNSKFHWRLALDIVEKYDVYVGMRSRKEFIASQDMFTTIVWVDGGDRVADESHESNELTRDDADIVINNDCTMEMFIDNVFDVMPMIVGGSFYRNNDSTRGCKTSPMRQQSHNDPNSSSHEFK